MISIIIPTYNEGQNIQMLLSELGRVGKRLQEPFEIVVVDDNSPDGTAEMVRRMDRGNVSLLVRKHQRGLTSAVRDGAKIAKGDKIIVIDADLSHPPEKVVGLIKGLKEADLVIGSRHLPGGGVEEWPWYRKIVSDGATMLSKFVIRHTVTDPMSGFFAIRKKILTRTALKVKGYKILMNILAKNPNIKIKEIPYVFRNRRVGKSKLNLKGMVTFILDVSRLLFT